MGYTVVIVVSPYGLGHATRMIALKDELLQMDEELRITFVCTDEQDSMLRRSILNSDRVSIEYIPFVPRLTMENWKEVDVVSTIASFQFSVDMDTQVRDDKEWGRILLDADLVINDIESVHNPIVKKMGLSIINISNFTWSDILHEFGAEELAAAYSDWERLADYNLKLPAAMDCRGFGDQYQEVGWLVRKFNWEEVERINSLSSRPIVFFSYSHRNWEMDLEEYFLKLHEAGYKIMCASKLVSEVDFEIITVRQDEPNIHHYIAAAAVVVTKVGYGTVAEVIGSGSRILFWKRENYAEDTRLATFLQDNNYGFEIPIGITPESLVTQVNRIMELEPSQVENSNREIAEFVWSKIA